MAIEATQVGGTHPTGMLSCLDCVGAGGFTHFRSIVLFSVFLHVYNNEADWPFISSSAW